MTTPSARALAGVVALLCLAPSALSEETVLENGVRVIVENRPVSETVAIRLLIAGGDFEETHRRGVSDLHAALLLRGTRKKSGFALAREAEELGGELSAFSRPLSESVILNVPAENLEPAMRLVEEAFLSARLDAEDLEKEKTLLAGSLATARDEPMTFLQDEIFRSLFPAHPLGRLASLTEAQVKEVTIDEIRAYHRSRLQPERLALIVVGNCSVERATGVARQLFATIGAPGRTPHGMLRVPALPLPQALPAGLTRHVRKRTTQPILALALPTAGVSDPEMPALTLLRQILGGFQERLYSEIREKRGYAYWVRTDAFTFPGAGAFEILTGAKKEHFPEIERLVRAEILRIASQPVSPEELRRAIRFTITQEARSDTTNSGRAGVLAAALLEGAPLRSYEERIARLSAVTASDIRDLARRLFHGRQFALVTMY